MYSYFLTDSTNTDYFALPMGLLVESIYGNGQKTTLLPGNITAAMPTQPLPMSMLDSLTVHTKMRFVLLVFLINTYLGLLFSMF